MLVLWMRRRRRHRRRSQRRSRIVEQTPPPNYESPPRKATPIFGNNGSSLTVPNPNGRFYGSQTLMEEKRRSFWRKSIRPEEIGVAVSPKMPDHESPASASSEQSFSRLLPGAPAAPLWPAPHDLGATRDWRSYKQQPISDVPGFDDEAQSKTQETEQIIVDNQPFILEKPPLVKRPREPPASLKLPVVPESRRHASQARIPLTPTYDNGNFQFASPPHSIRSPSQGRPPVAERRVQPSSFYLDRDNLQKHSPAIFPARDARGSMIVPLQQPRNAPRPLQAKPGSHSEATTRNVRLEMQRQSSVSSVHTEIEEDTTPEEIVKMLELRKAPIVPSIISTTTRPMPLPKQSPIKDLQYPQIPRSAAVSRQAEKPAQLRASLNLGASPTQLFPMAPPTRPRRDELVRAEASFMQTDTTSSDGYMSDSTIEFPVPPATKPRTSSLPQLKNNPSSGNKGALPVRTIALPDAESVSEPKMVDVAVSQRSPSSKARLTPSKSSSGDLYLTVEI